MKMKNEIQKVQLILISLVWILIFAIPVLFGEADNNINWDNIYIIWKEYLILIVIFLINRFILMPYLFFKGRRKLHFTSISVLIISFSSILFFANGDNKRPIPPREMMEMEGPGRGPEFIHGLPPMHPEQHAPMSPGVPPAGNLFIMSILIIGFDSGLLFFSKWMESEQNKLKAEKESINNKMVFLKNQISPHFFMNTLNNIHALIDINTEEAKEAIIKLSKMMDYMLYESQTNTISLKQEIDFIASYVDLMKLRFTDDIDIRFNFPSEILLVKIPPLLTISFIENAFKYGVSYESPSFIHIDIDVSSENLHFNIRNTSHRGKEKRKNSGIGIQNTRKRLELIYGSNYKLSIKDDEIFDVNLNIPI